MPKIARSEPWQHRFVEANGRRFHVVNWYRAAFRGGLPSAREFPKIAAPTLIIWGEGDVFLGKELTRGMRPYFSGPFSLKYLPGVSHWVQQEAPMKVNAFLTRFLAGSARR